MFRLSRINPFRRCLKPFTNPTDKIFIFHITVMNKKELH